MKSSMWIVCDSCSDGSEPEWSFSSKEKAEQAINNWINNNFNKFENHQIFKTKENSKYTGREINYYNFSWTQNGEEKEFEIKLFERRALDQEFPDDWDTYII